MGIEEDNHLTQVQSRDNKYSKRFFSEGHSKGAGLLLEQLSEGYMYKMYLIDVYYSQTYSRVVLLVPSK